MEEKHAIRLKGVQKSFRILKKGKGSLLASGMIVWDALRGKKACKHGAFQYFEAVKPLDLEIRAGESVAIVGRNGSGKSTLLEMIAGTLQATGGEIAIEGRVSALLQLGSGFNPEFTGRENIYLNAVVLGLSRVQLEEKLQGILDFADIGEFLDQPVKTYSSGMRLRLAFSVMTAVDPDILIVDEALSVGDTFFQSKCVRWLEEFLARKKTFLCVSHDMFLIRRLCTRGIVMDEGRMICDSEVADAANLYYRLHGKKPVLDSLKSKEEPADPKGEDGSGRWIPLELNIKERTGDGRVMIDRIFTRPGMEETWKVGQWIQIRVGVVAKELLDAFEFGFGFRDRSGQLIGGYHSFYTDDSFSIRKCGVVHWLEFDLKLDLKPQLYLLTVGLAINHTVDDWYDLDCIWDCAQIAVQGSEIYWGLTPLPARNIKLIPRNG